MKKRKHAGLTTEQIMEKLRTGDFVDARGGPPGHILGYRPKPQLNKSKRTPTFWHGVALVLAIDLALVLTHVAGWW